MSVSKPSEPSTLIEPTVQIKHTRKISAPVNFNALKSYQMKNAGILANSSDYQPRTSAGSGTPIPATPEEPNTLDSISETDKQNCIIS